MTGQTRAELERRLVRHLREEAERVMDTVEIHEQQELLESRLRRIRRWSQPRYLMAAAAAAAAAVVAVVLVITRANAPHATVPASPPRLPQPAATTLTVYRAAAAQGSVRRVTTFLDTRGRWCAADIDSGTAPTASDYNCRSAKLPASGHGFGAVYGTNDAPSYDNFRSWFGGVATADVVRVKVVFSDGRVKPARLLDQGSANGVVFSLAWPTTPSTTPTYYRAYAAGGHLIQQLKVEPLVLAH